MSAVFGLFGYASIDSSAKPYPDRCTLVHLSKKDNCTVYRLHYVVILHDFVAKCRASFNRTTIRQRTVIVRWVTSAGHSCVISTVESTRSHPNEPYVHQISCPKQMHHPHPTRVRTKRESDVGVSRGQRNALKNTIHRKNRPVKPSLPVENLCVPLRMIL